MADGQQTLPDIHHIALALALARPSCWRCPRGWGRVCRRSVQICGERGRLGRLLCLLALAGTPIQLLLCNRLLSSCHDLLLLLLVLSRGGDRSLWPRGAIARAGWAALGGLGNRLRLGDGRRDKRGTVGILYKSLWRTGIRLRDGGLRRRTGGRHTGGRLGGSAVWYQTAQRRGHGWRRRRCGGRTTRNWRWGPWVFKAAFMILGESRTARRRGSAPVIVCGVGVIELVPHFIVVSSSVLFVESHDVHHGLRVLFLFLL